MTGRLISVSGEADGNLRERHSDSGADQHVTWVMQSEDYPGKRNQHRKRQRDEKQQLFGVAKQQREADRMQCVPGRKTVAIKRRGA